MVTVLVTVMTSERDVVSEWLSCRETVVDFVSFAV